MVDGAQAPVVALISNHPAFVRECARTLGSSGLQLVECVLPTHLSQHSLIPAADASVVDAENSAWAEYAIKLMNQLRDSPRIIAVASDFGETLAFTLLALGVRGFLQDPRGDSLERAIRQVHAGRFWIARDILGRFVEEAIRSNIRPKPPQSLSPREVEIYQLLVGNNSNKEIADSLNISVRTAKFHVSNILAKFGVRRRADLILLARVSPQPDRPGAGLA